MPQFGGRKPVSKFLEVGEKYDAGSASSVTVRTFRGALDSSPPDGIFRA